MEKKKKEELKRRLAKRLTKALKGSRYHSKKKRGVLKAGVAPVNVTVKKFPQAAGIQFTVTSETTPRNLINQHVNDEDGAISYSILVNGGFIYTGNGVGFDEGVGQQFVSELAMHDTVFIMPPGTSSY